MHDLETQFTTIRKSTTQPRLRTMLVAAILTLIALIAFVAPVGAGNNGQTQVSGSGVFDTGNCVAYNVNPNNPLGGTDAHFAIDLNVGDMLGCMYIIVDDFSCSPSGTYRESGREIYVIDGGELGLSGIFETTYFARAKFTECDPDLGLSGSKYLASANILSLRVTKHPGISSA